jgi:hypothetical protein
LGFLHKRIKSKIIKTQTIKPSNEEQNEQYFYQMLLLFKPWRNESLDLKQNFNSYEESFLNAVKNNTINNILVTQFQDQQKRIKEAIGYANKLIEQAKISIQSEENSNDLTSTNEYCQNLLNLGVNDFKQDKIDKEELNLSVESLNKEQKDIYNIIIDQISNQSNERSMCKQCNNKNTKIYSSSLHKCSYQNIKPLKLFVSGVAGTGKSFLIETLCKKIKLDYSGDNIEWSVAVLAPTGIAAFNINGLTIHRFFKLPVFNENQEKHWQLTDDALKIMRTYLPNLKLIIIGKILSIIRIVIF